jgi:S-adenosylmethionine:tRNA ribosyltransferase-isomerase
LFARPVLAQELDYDLPEELIATRPSDEREGSRLLVVDRATHTIEHRSTRELPGLLSPSLFVFNDTRVIPARLLGVRPSGGKFEILLIERLTLPGSEERWIARGRPLKSLREGLELRVGDIDIRVGKRLDALSIEVTLRAPQSVAESLEHAGELPLPPYMNRPADERDRERYQTVFAREPGAVAAPTAGLHFGESMLAALEAAGHTRAFVTLHVGPGTFAPLLVDDLRDHPMHEERYALPQDTVDAIREAKHEGRKVVAVGTTVVRTLEASAATGELRAGPSATRICIFPPYGFRVVDALVTNFHLPRSTLLALVMAFSGTELTREAYRKAVAERYRFFSYGDAMLIR